MRHMEKFHGKFLKSYAKRKLNENDDESLGGIRTYFAAKKQKDGKQLKAASIAD